MLEARKVCPKDFLSLDLGKSSNTWNFLKWRHPLAFIVVNFIMRIVYRTLMYRIMEVHELDDGRD